MAESPAHSIAFFKYSNFARSAAFDTGRSRRGGERRDAPRSGDEPPRGGSPKGARNRQPPEASIVVEQNPVGVAFRVGELAAPHRPEESAKAGETEEDGDGDQDDEDVHRAALAAFSDTVIEEADIARAAISGVAKPMSATGTAIRL